MQSQDTQSWYWASQPEPPALAPLLGEQSCDVGVVGAGIAGLSAALHLAQRGYRVTVLEAQRIGWGASGRSGAQAIFGVAAGQDKLKALVGAADARRIWDMSVEALSLLRELIATHDIDCDWRSGQMHVAIKPRQQRELSPGRGNCRTTTATTRVRYLDRPAVRELVASDRYIAGMHDTQQRPPASAEIRARPGRGRAARRRAPSMSTAACCAMNASTAHCSW